MSAARATQPAVNGPVRPGPGAHAALRPVPAATISDGFWHSRRVVNASVSIPQGPELLESAGNLHDLRLAAGTAQGEYRGHYPFMDSDVYKWLEAACWQLGQWTAAGGAGSGPAGALAGQVERITALVTAAQQVDGYLNTWFQVTGGGEPYRDLRWGHELYCAGHLIQAAVAHHRSTGGKELLEAAVRFADHIDSAFGPGRRIDGFDGHPEVETALVELYRETGERRYLDLAAYFVERHGHGLLGGEAYCQDRVPLRGAATVEGHAVRQLYLMAAAADLATETGDAGLRAACERLWAAMTAAKTHLTGGLGAHHDMEDFGDPYELPTERAYCETCAAVASVQWSWRMALLTGQARYGDLVERTLYNGVLAGVSLDGDRWLYVNPLQVRDGHTDTGRDQSARRTRWFRCACCPPNVMRLLAGLEHYVATTDARGLQIHQYATGRFGGELHGEPLFVSAHTDYPQDGRVTVTVEQTPAGPWTLSLRIPQWCERFAVRVGERGLADPSDGPNAPGTPDVRDLPADDGWLRLERGWAPGDQVVVELDLRPRLTAADPRVDAVRGCVAIERGPLVYCLEEADHPGGLDDVTIDPAGPLRAVHRPGLLGGVTAVVARGARRPRQRRGEPAWWPYRTVTPPERGAGPGSAVAHGERSGIAELNGHARSDACGERDAHTAEVEPGVRADAATPSAEPLELTAVPYYAWANREDGGMRVWLPTH